MTTLWLSISPDSPFPLANIPSGIISTEGDTKPRLAISIGVYALDLPKFGRIYLIAIDQLSSLFESISPESLNRFAWEKQNRMGEGIDG